MLLIISAHVALIALAMSAKMEFRPKPNDHTTVVNVPIPTPSPPLDPSTDTQPKPRNLALSIPKPDVPLPPADPSLADPGPKPDTGLVVGGGGGGTAQFPINLLPLPVRHEARLITSAADLKPPYPQTKVLSGEEADLQLRLTISESGRVTAVESIGAADRVFLDAARRYLIARWRYQPATEDGRAVASTVVIHLRFQLDG